jgi:hypothetical protein
LYDELLVLPFSLAFLLLRLALEQEEQLQQLVLVLERLVLLCGVSIVCVYVDSFKPPPFTFTL